MINTIKEKILQKDAGSFQILCDTILAKEGYKNILSLGTQAGTQKTTLGTPDTYFYDNDNKKYIFVEYTTQKKGLISKIENDIEKCLDASKTGIPTNKISKIIYFHTSSNITPKDDKRFREMCEKLGIVLRLCGIDQLSYDLYLKHRNIAKDLLGVSMDTGQIKDLEDFIQVYNENKLAAPISNDFLFREKEIIDLEEAFKTENIVIVSGPSGVGKTKLCIQFAEEYAKKHSGKLFCIRDNSLPIYEDLKQYLDQPGKYFIFIDDANQLNGLKYVIPYTTMQDKGYDVKIIASVRDYAADKVRDDIKIFSSFSEISITAFKKEEIETLLKKEFEIKNFLYLDRIFEISKGNARLAMLAGKISINTNKLESINDASQLYDEYYGVIVKDNKLFDDTRVLIVAGIISVLKSIHLDNICVIMPLLELYNIDEALFVEIIKKLHECEVVDIYYNKAVRVTDQCLANFLLKYVLYNKQAIGLSELIEFGFLNFKQKTIEAVNTLINIFNSEDIIAFVGKHIKLVWEKLKKEEPTVFFEFVKIFYLFNPTESLVLVQKMIQNSKQVSISVEDIDKNTGKNREGVDDDIINILTGFKDNENWEAALDLLFKYYLKRPDLFIQFYHGINISFGIDRFSCMRKYDLQVKLFETIRKNSQSWKNEYINLLFFELAPKFLAFTFSSTEASGAHSVTFYNFNIDDINALEYRALIWNALVEFSKNIKYQPKVYVILNEYSSHIRKESKEIIEKEHKYIIDIFNELPYKKSLIVNILAQQINNSMVRCELKTECIIPELYINSDKMSIYSLLNEADFEHGISYEEKQEQKKVKIREAIKENTNIIVAMIDVCNELSHCPFKRNFYTIYTGLNISFEMIPDDKNVLLPLVRYYINADTPLNLNPQQIIDKMFKVALPQEIFLLINEKNYKNRNIWNYEYYYQIPEKYVTTEELENLYVFLSDTTGLNQNAYPLRTIAFINKFKKVSNDVLKKCCRIILSKNSIPCIYFEQLFDKYSQRYQNTMELFKDNIDLLIDIYMHIIPIKGTLDKEGIFFKKIYCMEKSILDRYVDYIITIETIHYDYIYRRLHSFFETDEYETVYDYVMCRIMREKEYPDYELQKFMSCIVTYSNGNKKLVRRQDEWIKDFIVDNAKNSTKIKCIFEAISNLDNERRKEYILLLIEKNPDYEIFENLRLTPTNYSWSGSEVPILSGFIDYLNDLLPHLNGIEYIKHKDRVTKIIEEYYKAIEKAQIRDTLYS